MRLPSRRAALLVGVAVTSTALAGLLVNALVLVASCSGEPPRGADVIGWSLVPDGLGCSTVHLLADGSERLARAAPWDATGPLLIALVAAALLAAAAMLTGRSGRTVPPPEG